MKFWGHDAAINSVAGEKPSCISEEEGTSNRLPLTSSFKPSIICIRAISICATVEVCRMNSQKKIFEFADYIVTIIVRPKTAPKAENDNLEYDFWSDELKELYDRYEK